MDAECLLCPCDLLLAVDAAVLERSGPESELLSPMYRFQLSPEDPQALEVQMRPRVESPLCLLSTATSLALREIHMGRNFPQHPEKLADVTDCVTLSHVGLSYTLLAFPSLIGFSPFCF